MCRFQKVLLALGALSISAFAASMVSQNLDYSDHLQSFYNPDIGFYTPQTMHLKVSGNTPIAKPYGRFLHLRAELSEFSDKAWWLDKGDTVRGKSQDLTEDALQALGETLDNVRKNSGTTIIRFCYDPWYNGHSNTTPDQSVILRHLEQLAPVLSEHLDVITAWEIGIYGAYGEMHSDTMITHEKVGEAIRFALEHTPPELKILTRTPRYAAYALGFAKNAENPALDADPNVHFNVESEVFQRIAKAKKDTLFRLGMFNDGYLGTQYDYGTWSTTAENGISREEGVAWLETYGMHTPYGGEALTTASGYQEINTPDFIAYEGFRTHTSYLNIQWNYNLIERWKNTDVFTARKSNIIDSGYNGTSGFKYINDHLGYRFVLRNSRMNDSVGIGEQLQVALLLQNVGFGNVTRKKATTLIFKSDANESIYEIRPDSATDIGKILSRKMNADTTISYDGTDTLRILAKLPEEMPLGLWNVFVRFSENGDFRTDENFSVIRFANDSNYFDKETGSNFVGTFILSDRIQSLQSRPVTSAVELRQNGKMLIVRHGQEIEILDLNGVLQERRAIPEREWIWDISKFSAGPLVVRVKDRNGIARIQKIECRK